MPAARKGPTRLSLPIILIRGFGGLDVEEERALAYQGFNVGSVYPHKRGENYIYEGMILRLLKDRRRYHDATNVVGFFRKRIEDAQELPEELKPLDPGLFTDHKIVVDPTMAAKLLREVEDPFCTVWVFRYYDLDDDQFAAYGEALVRLIDLILNLLELKGDPKRPRMVNIIAHSMGGLIVREAIQVTLPKAGRDPASLINKIVTLGTPHKGITFQRIEDFRWLRFRAEQELEHFNPNRQADPDNPAAWVNFGKHFPLDRLLTVVGTNYRSYGVRVASLANRLFSVRGEYGPNYNRSDGLVKQSFAQIDGAPRTFVHKCHGGHDSLVTSREAYEIATRFFRGNVRARLRLVRAKVKRGLDRFGRSELFFGVSIKPRRVDFELFHQSKEAENCYGPFREPDLSDPDPSFGWAGADRLIWEGCLDVDLEQQNDLVLRLDVYVGERDLFGIGFSDNVIFHKQYYVQAVLENERTMRKGDVTLYLHTGEDFQAGDAKLPRPLPFRKGGWEFKVTGTGFDGTLRIELDSIPPIGDPKAIEAP